MCKRKCEVFGHLSVLNKNLAISSAIKSLLKFPLLLKIKIVNFSSGNRRVCEWNPKVTPSWWIAFFPKRSASFNPKP